MVNSSTTVPIYGMTITLVDPVNSHIEGVLKTSDARKISVYTTPIAFRWPVVGEDWMCQQINGTWYLVGPWPNVNASTPITSVNPGDVILNSPTGVVHVIGSEDPTLDFTITATSFIPLTWNAFTFFDSNWKVDTNHPPKWAIDTDNQLHVTGSVQTNGSINYATNATIAQLPPTGSDPTSYLIGAAGAVSAGDIFFCHVSWTPQNGRIVLARTPAALANPANLFVNLCFVTPYNVV